MAAKANHVLASYDDAGNYTILGEPLPYDEARAELLGMIEGGGAPGKVALISLRAGVRKRRRIAEPEKRAARKKKASTKKSSS